MVSLKEGERNKYRERERKEKTNVTTILELSLVT